MFQSGEDLPNLVAMKLSFTHWQRKNDNHNWLRYAADMCWGPNGWTYVRKPHQSTSLSCHLKCKLQKMAIWMLILIQSCLVNKLGRSFLYKNVIFLGSGCGSVGRAVNYDTGGPWFKSYHRQNLYSTLFTVNWSERHKIERKMSFSM